MPLDFAFDIITRNINLVFLALLGSSDGLEIKDNRNVNSVRSRTFVTEIEVYPQQTGIHALFNAQLTTAYNKTARSTMCRLILKSSVARL